jgi:DNA-binding CsgD family transcriptional regulator
LLGAAAAIRRRGAMVRFAIHEADYSALLDRIRDALPANEFESAWAEGEAMSPDDAIDYGTRGRGTRQRPDTGWPALTPAELDVVRLVCEGLGNKEIAARLFISPRTVQAHLSHVFTKLGLTSRVQLVQEAARHA